MAQCLEVCYWTYHVREYEFAGTILSGNDQTYHWGHSASRGRCRTLSRREVCTWTSIGEYSSPRTAGKSLHHCDVSNSWTMWWWTPVDVYSYHGFKTHWNTLTFVWLSTRGQGKWWRSSWFRLVLQVIAISANRFCHSSTIKAIKRYVKGLTQILYVFLNI